MIKLIDQIRKDYIAARKARNAVVSNLLSTLIGELESKATTWVDPDVKEDKPVVIKVIDDALVTATVKKFIKSLDEIIAVNESTLSKREKNILEAYLPQQMSEQELRDVALLFVNGTIGEFMGHLKNNYAGSYDGRLASKIYNEVK